MHVGLEHVGILHRHHALHEAVEVGRDGVLHHELALCHRQYERVGNGDVLSVDID